MSGKAVGIFAIVDRHGLSLSMSTNLANHYEVILVRLTFDFYLLEVQPEHFIADQAYDSNGLDDNLQQDGINLIGPHHSTRKLKTQDGYHLRQFERGWLLERLFAWLQWEAGLAYSLSILCIQLSRVHRSRAFLCIL